MGNKVIRFGKSSSFAADQTQQDVFVDVDMTSSPNSNREMGIKSTWQVDSDKNVAAVHNALHNIFTWIPGERILNPEFGSKIRNLLYEGITSFNVEQIVSEIRNSVSEWEPRVQIQNVVNASTPDDDEDNTVRLEVIYTIPELSDKKYSYSIIQRISDN